MHPDSNNTAAIIILIAALAIDLEGKPRRLIVIYIASGTNALVTLANELKPHEWIGLLVDILSIIAFTIATIRWWRSRERKKRELERWTPQQDPKYYG